MFKKFAKEFKEFALKGNMLDMAVGLIMGTAFSGLVTQLTDSFISPLLGIVTGGIDFSALSFSFGDAVFTYGQFITTVITFILQALVLFLLIKAFHSLKKEAPAPVTTKKCPYCQSDINIKAIRCPNCTSDLKK